MRSIIFAKRVGKEISRDVLSFIFCILFPLVMLIIMSVVDASIPPEANMTLFHIENLAPGIACFGQSFLMLFAAIQVSRDRSTALLIRLYASPMKPMEYVLGYTLPMCVLGIIQVVICYASAFVIGMIRGYTFDIGQMLLSMVLLLPSLLMFVGIGMLFGSAINDKAAPGVCSIIISAVGIIGGVWMDVDTLGGVIKDVAEVLPFYHAVKLARMPFAGEMSGVAVHLIWTLGCGIVFYILAAAVFAAKMKKDLK